MRGGYTSPRGILIANRDVANKLPRSLLRKRGPHEGVVGGTVSADFACVFHAEIPAWVSTWTMSDRLRPGIRNAHTCTSSRTQAGREREHVQAHVGISRALGEFVQLLTHDAGRADQLVQRRLVRHRDQLERGRAFPAAQCLLAPGPDFQQLPDLLLQRLSMSRKTARA